MDGHAGYCSIHAGLQSVCTCGAIQRLASNRSQLRGPEVEKGRPFVEGRG